MPEILEVADLHIEVVKKAIKNIHLTVHPPDGRVRIAAPQRTDVGALRLFVIDKLPWIRRQQQELLAQERETPREYLDRESHYVWGRRYLMRVKERDAGPEVVIGHSELTLYVRPLTDEARREEIVALWYRDRLREAVAPMIAKWCAVIGVPIPRVFVQRMKTKWGSCNPDAATIRLNSELAKKPPECMEYVLVHELVHLLEPTHNDRFRGLMDQYLPPWRLLRAELNRAPVAHEDWDY
jgi:predicted metal-dependent hydrolase